MNAVHGSILDSFKGALLGTAVGDALGMPVEGWQHEKIVEQHEVLKEMAEARAGRGTYTDDTEMMIALAESLTEKRKVDKNHLAQSFLKNFHDWRGYGYGTTTVLELLRRRIPVEDAATAPFPGGSYGNGSVMRAAPIGLLYFYHPELLKRAAYLQSQVTHCHPLACEGSFLQALAIAMLIEKRQQGSGLEARAFLEELSQNLSEGMEPYQKALHMVGMLLDRLTEKEDVVRALGNDSRIVKSWPAALYSFLNRWNSFEEAVIYAVNLGGDTDTIGAMTGALAGAYHGAASIPERWLLALENGEKGRDCITSLAEQLYTAACQSQFIGLEQD